MRRDGIDMGCPGRRSVGLLCQEVQPQRPRMGTVGVGLHFHCASLMRLKQSENVEAFVIVYVVLGDDGGDFVNRRNGEAAIAQHFSFHSCYLLSFSDAIFVAF